MSKAERETVIRWDCDDRSPVMYTADPAQARRWTRLGYAVTAVVARTDGGTTGWRAVGPANCVRFRRLQDGALVKRANGARNSAVQPPFLRGPQAEAPSSPTGSARRRTP